MFRKTKFKNLWIGENEISNPDMQIIIHTAFPHCAVTFPTNPVDQEDYNARTQLQIFESAPYTEADIKRTTALMREFVSATPSPKDGRSNNCLTHIY